MNLSDNRTFYVIEVAPSQFLALYLPGGCSVITPHIFSPYESNSVGQEIEGSTIWAKRFTNIEAFRVHVYRLGNKEDFLEWCKDLQEKYGGDGKPRIRKVNIKINAEVEEGDPL